MGASNRRILQLAARGGIGPCGAGAVFARPRAARTGVSARPEIGTAPTCWSPPAVSASGIVGTSTTVITAEEIERSPEDACRTSSRARPASRPQSVRGVERRATSVDMRGFGVTAPSNTLVLVNGRRLNDSILPASTFARSRATASSASRSRAATAARCFTAMVRSAASSTSSPRPASSCRRRRAWTAPSARSTTGR